MLPYILILTYLDLQQVMLDLKHFGISEAIGGAIAAVLLSLLSEARGRRWFEHAGPDFADICNCNLGHANEQLLIR